MIEYKYRAFISYSHADQKWGRWLHRALETFKIPKEIVGQETTAGVTPARLGKVFRDDDELGTSANLGDKITAALGTSDVLIVICSPNAAQSAWVNKEIADFKALGRAHRVFAMIVGGEPNSTNPEQECFPGALKYQVDDSGLITDELEEPLATDVRKFGRQDSLLRLISGILDVDYDILKNRERVRVRRQARRAQLLFTSGLSLSIVAMISLWFSIINQYNGLTNRSVSFAQISTRYSEVDKHDRAMLWALGGIPSQSQVIKEDYSQARAQLIRSYRKNVVLRGQTGLRYADFSPDRSRVITVAVDGVAWISDAESGDQLVSLEGHTDDILFATFSPDNQLVVTSSSDTTARIWDVATGEQIALLDTHTATVRHASFSPDGTRVITASEDNSAILWQLPDSHDSGSITQTPLIGHTDRVRRAHFSPDGSTIVTASYDNTAIVWDGMTGQQLSSLTGHGDDVFNALFNYDGSRIVTASGDGTARVWDSKTGTQISEMAGEKYYKVYHAAFNPDGTRIVTGATDGTVRVWSADYGGQLQIYTDHRVLGASAPGADKVNAIGGSEIYYVSFSPDGNHILSASRDTTARIWDARTQQKLVELTDHEKLVLHAAFSKDGHRIITVSGDDTARIWDWQTGREQISLNGDVFTSQNANMLITTQTDALRVRRANSVTVRNGNDGNIVSTLADIKNNTATDIAASTSGTRIVASFDYFNNTGPHVGVWDGETGQKLAELEHEGPVKTVSINHRGDRVFTHSTDGAGRLWDLITKKVVQELNLPMGTNNRVFAIFSADDQSMLLSQHYDAPGRFSSTGSLKNNSLHNGKTGELIKDFGWSHTLFTADGNFVISASKDNRLSKTDSITGAEVFSAEIQNEFGEISVMVLAADNSTALTGSLGGTARLWDLETGEPVLVLNHNDPVHQAAISPDSNWVVTASTNQNATLWDGTTGKDILAMTGVRPAFSPDSSRFALSSSDNIVRLRDSATGQELAEMSIHNGMVSDLFFTPDGTHLVTKSTDKTTRFWDAMAKPASWDLSEILENSCDRANKNGFNEYKDTFPILAGVAPNGSRLKNPCDKRGLLGLEWWQIQSEKAFGPWAAK